MRVVKEDIVGATAPPCSEGKDTGEGQEEEEEEGEVTQHRHGALPRSRRNGLFDVQLICASATIHVGEFNLCRCAVAMKHNIICVLS